MTQRSRSQKKEIENNMLLASNLRNMLQIKESEAQEMQDVINSTMEHHKAENEAMQIVTYLNSVLQLLIDSVVHITNIKER